MNIDKNNWYINIDKEGLIEAQLKVVYKFLSGNYTEGRYIFKEFRNLVDYSLEKKGVYNWDLIGVVGGKWTVNCSADNEYLNVPEISYNDFDNYILKNGDEGVVDTTEVLIEVGQVYRKVDPEMWFEGVDCITISHQDSDGRWCESTDTHFITEDDVRNGVFELVEDTNKEHQYEPLVSEGLVSFCTDTGSVVNIISEQEVWIKWRGLQWNIVGWSDKKFNKLVKKIKWLEESSCDEEGC